MKKKILLSCTALILFAALPGLSSQACTQPSVQTGMLANMQVKLSNIPIIGFIVDYFKEDPDHYELTCNQQDMSNMATTVVSARDKDDEELWCFTTDPYELTELCQPVELLEHDNTYYFCSGTTIYALNSKSGECKWTNSEFGGYATACTMDNSGDNLYVAGYYGPFFAVIDSDGKTVHRFAEAQSSDGTSTDKWCNPISMCRMYDNVVITYENGARALVDPETGVGKAYNSTDSVSSSPSGSAASGSASSGSAAYTDEQYSKMAKDYYKSINNQTPPLTDVTHNGDGTVTIRLYEDMGGYYSSWDFYTVDEKTLKGSDIAGNSISLK